MFWCGYDSVCIKLPSGSTSTQTVTFDGILKFCRFCRCLGHFAVSCHNIKDSHGADKPLQSPAAVDANPRSVAPVPVLYGDGLNQHIRSSARVAGLSVDTIIHDAPPMPKRRSDSWNIQLEGACSSPAPGTVSCTNSVGSVRELSASCSEHIVDGTADQDLEDAGWTRVTRRKRIGRDRDPAEPLYGHNSADSTKPAEADFKAAAQRTVKVPCPANCVSEPSVQKKLFREVEKMLQRCRW